MSDGDFEIVLGRNDDGDGDDEPRESNEKELELVEEDTPLCMKSCDSDSMRASSSVSSVKPSAVWSLEDITLLLDTAGRGGVVEGWLEKDWDKCVEGRCVVLRSKGKFSRAVCSSG